MEQAVVFFQPAHYNIWLIRGGYCFRFLLRVLFFVGYGAESFWRVIPAISPVRAIAVSAFLN